MDNILEQGREAGALSARAMFGEYALYLDGRIVGLICDDTLYLKDFPAARALLTSPETGAPYPGAKPHLIADALLDDPEELARVLRAVRSQAPEPKPRKSRR